MEKERAIEDPTSLGHVYSYLGHGLQPSWR